MSIITRVLPIVVALLFGVSTYCIAADRALLVGVTNYPGINDQLPGIDLDLRLMQETAGLLGFAPENIKVVYDDEATLLGIEESFSKWLIEGVGPEDRVLFYFSGHGSQVPDVSGDELDGLDEVLLAYDAKEVSDGESQSLVNVVLDDVLSTWLAKIPSQNILVLVDACHSGTVTRSFGLKRLKLGEQYAYSKSYTYDGAPPKAINYDNVVRQAVQSNVVDIAESAATNYIRAGAAEIFESSVSSQAQVAPSFLVQEGTAVLTAARDDQEALATSQGSVFTLAVHSVIEEAARTGRDVTLEDVQRRTNAIISDTVDPELVHNPSLSGDNRVVQASLEIMRLVQGNGPRWSALEDLASSEVMLRLTVNEDRFDVGDEFVVDVEIPFDGYLNLVSVNSEDSTTVLFPNKYHPDNSVQRGTFTFPSEGMPFAILAMEPVGPTLITAFVTDYPVNLMESGIAGRNDAGEIASVFTSLSARGAKTLGIVPRPLRSNVANGSATVPEVEAGRMVSVAVVVEVSRPRSKPHLTRVDVMKPLLAVTQKASVDAPRLTVNLHLGLVPEARLGQEISFQIEAKGPYGILLFRIDSFGNVRMSRPALIRSTDGRYIATFPATGFLKVEPPLGMENVFAVRVPGAVADNFAVSNTSTTIGREQAAAVISDLARMASEFPEFSVDHLRYRVIAPGQTLHSSGKAIIREFEAQASAPAPIEFDFDSANLVFESELELDQFGDALVDGPFRRSRIRMVGHTDNEGTEEYNLRLGGTRAQAAHRYLISNFGLDAERFEVVSAGKSDPIATNETEAGRALNRRVHFEIIE